MVNLMEGFASKPARSEQTPAAKDSCSVLGNGSRGAKLRSEPPFVIRWSIGCGRPVPSGIDPVLTTGAAGRVGTGHWGKKVMDSGKAGLSPTSGENSKSGSRDKIQFWWWASSKLNFDGRIGSDGGSRDLT